MQNTTDTVYLNYTKSGFLLLNVLGYNIIILLGPDRYRKYKGSENTNGMEKILELESLHLNERYCLHAKIKLGNFI